MTTIASPATPLYRGRPDRHGPIPPGTLAAWVADARRRTFDLVADLGDEQLLGEPLAIVNPLQWEIGHVAWFQEKWVLRHAAGRAPLDERADALYDSAAIPHDVRWDLPLLRRDVVLAYLQRVGDLVLERIHSSRLSADDVYFVLLSLFHEDMHTEAFTYTRQTLGYPQPHLNLPLVAPTSETGALPGDVAIPGGTFLLGATREEPFVFDNEKWAHPVEVKPFALASAPVTQAEFAAFVEAGGYRRREWWSEAGWQWRERTKAEHPVYWQRQGSGGWLRRDFDRWLPLEPHRPVLHVNWYEAGAYCRWADRRLPTEAEWEYAAATVPGENGVKRRYPWGDTFPTAEQARLDWQGMGCSDVAARAAGESAWGCRQMLGNVWEWTADDFLPYPGFQIDPYQEYSAPWFGTHKVLRGGCWVTRARLLRNTWRNYYPPDRRDVWAGFRTCALRP